MHIVLDRFGNSDGQDVFLVRLELIILPAGVLQLQDVLRISITIYALRPNNIIIDLQLHPAVGFGLAEERKRE